MIGLRMHALLRRVKLLSLLDDNELALVWEICRLREVAAGETIMQAGADGESLFFFLEGSVDVWAGPGTHGRKRSAAATAKPLVRLSADVVSVFGEMAVLTNEPRSATLTAASACTLYEVSRDDFTTLCNREPALGVKLLRGIAIILAERVRQGNDEQIRLWKVLAKAMGDDAS